MLTLSRAQTVGSGPGGILMANTTDDEIGRYSTVAQAFHWVSAALMFAVVPIAWYMTTLEKTDPSREEWYSLHKSIGLTILALSVLRVIWRHLSPPPARPGQFTPLEIALAHGAHLLLYILLFAMPVSGYLISAAGGHPIVLWGLLPVPTLVPVNHDLAHVGVLLHDAGQWALYGLVGLHVLATAQHTVIKHDGVLGRMLPSRRQAPDSAAINRPV